MIHHQHQERQLKVDHAGSSDHILMKIEDGGAPLKDWEGAFGLDFQNLV
jgi:hypothetical protein